MDKLPPLNAVRAFEAAARHLSITRAAEELFVTPSAISRQIRQLEAIYQAKLFVRGHRQISLTRQGSNFYEAVSETFDGLREATRQLSKRAQRKQLKVRSYVTFATRWLIPRLSGFHSSCPDIEVLLTASTEEVDFRREDIDGAVRLGDGRWHGTVAYRLCSNILTPVTSPALVKQRSIVRPSDLNRENLLHSMARIDDWSLWLRSVDARNVDAHAGMTYQNSAMAFEAAIAGQGVAIAPRFLVEKDLRDGMLVAPFEQTLDTGEFTYYLIVPSDRPETQYMVRFRMWLLNQFAPAQVDALTSMRLTL